MWGSQPGEGGLGYPQATYMSPKLYLILACLKFLLRDNIPKNSFLVVSERGAVHLQYLL
jgi:hypothetical protein